MAAAAGGAAAGLPDFSGDLLGLGAFDGEVCEPEEVGGRRRLRRGRRGLRLRGERHGGARGGGRRRGRDQRGPWCVDRPSTSSGYGPWVSRVEVSPWRAAELYRWPAARQARRRRWLFLVAPRAMGVSCHCGDSDDVAASSLDLHPATLVWLGCECVLGTVELSLTFQKLSL